MEEAGLQAFNRAQAEEEGETLVSAKA